MSIFAIDVRFVSRVSGLRLGVAPKTVKDPITWSMTEDGGAEQLVCALALPFEELPVSPGDYAEVWASGESVPRWRGFVAIPERDLSSKAEFLTLTAFGRMQDMDSVLENKVIPHYELDGADLSVYAAELFADYQQRKAASTAYAPRLVQDIQSVGVSLQQLALPNVTVRAGMSKLFEQAAGNAVWGWDIDPATGCDRFYFRPRVATVGNVWRIGHSVKAIKAPSELQNVYNAIQIEGGPAQYPNYLQNSSFEIPTAPNAETGNLLDDGGFEYGATPPNGWTYVSGASRTEDNGFVNHSPHTGLWEVPLDAPGKEVWQEVAVSLNTAYIGSLFAALQSTSSATIQFIVEGRNSAGTVVETPIQQTITPASTAWIGGQGSTVLASNSLAWNAVFTNAATTHARIRAVCTAGSNSHGVMIDDVVFSLATAAGQTGWSDHVQNPSSTNNKFVFIDWISRQAAWDGVYGVRLSCVADSGDKPALSILGNNQNTSQNAYFKPTPQQSLMVCAMVRMSPGLNTAAGSLNVECRSWAGDGHENDFQTVPYAVANDGAWHLVFKQPWSIHGDTAQAACQLTFASSGVYDVDAFSARDSAALPLTLAAIAAGSSASVIEAAYRQEYLRGDKFERYVDIADPAVAPLLTAAAAASIATYGRREVVVNNADIVAWNADSQAYVAGLFNAHAVLITRPRIDIAHEPSVQATPGSGTQVAVTGSGTVKDAPNDIPAAWPAKTSYAYSKGALALSLELTNQRPTLAKLLKTVASGASGGGSASSIAAISGGNTNGGVGGTLPAPAALFQVDTFLASAQAGGVFGAGPYALSQTASGLVMVFGDTGFIIPAGYSQSGTSLTFGSGTTYALWQQITVIYQYAPPSS